MVIDPAYQFLSQQYRIDHLYQARSNPCTNISKNTALRRVASCSPRPPDVPGAHNVNSSSGCYRPGSFRPGAASFRPDAPGAPWRSLLSNHTPSAKPLPPAAPVAPVRLPPPPEAFRPRILSSQTRSVPSHDTPLPLNLSRTLPYPTLFLPYPAEVFLPPSSSPPPLPILLVGRTFSVFAGRSRYSPDVLLLLLFSPSTLHTLLVRRTFIPSAERFYRPPNVIPSAWRLSLPFEPLPVRPLSIHPPNSLL